MAKQITFITVQELKDSTPIQPNVSEKILAQCILEFQELELEVLLGKAYKRLSNELVKVATVPAYTLSDDDTELLRYIKPFLCYGALLGSLSPLNYKVTNKGIKVLSDDNAITDDKSLTALRSNYSSKLDSYKKRLIDYMATDEVEETPNNASADTTFSFTGISIPDNTRDWEQIYKDSAYKTGYYRRRYF